MPFDSKPETRTYAGMSLEEMERVGNQAAAIRSANTKLREAERKLELFKKCMAAENRDALTNWSWEPEIILEKGQGYNPATKIKIRIPAEMIQQQLVDDIKRAKRKLIALGGMP